jgi:2-polyprenyl-3-methyl-5-hydroxy-6-metoxy-1,4-benzoquinol methylase
VTDTAAHPAPDDPTATAAGGAQVVARPRTDAAEAVAITTLDGPRHWRSTARPRSRGRRRLAVASCGRRPPPGRHAMATELDEGAREAFFRRMLTVLNDGMLALGISIGHRAGLFDVLGDGRPRTSDELAADADADERYVREWLGAMTVSGVVEYDPAAVTWRLPPEHAASLTATAGSTNVARLMQFVPMLGEVESEVLECVRHGGGVGYDAFTGFARVSADDTAHDYDEDLVGELLAHVPGMVERLRAGADVADVGCGSGHILCVMAGMFPASRFTGFDIAEDALTSARAAARDAGLDNVAFVRRDAAALAETDAFDLVTTFDAVHDQARPDLLLAGIVEALRPDGAYLCIDIRASSDLEDNVRHPMGPFIYVVSLLHCMTVSLAQGGMGLGTAWGHQLATRMLHEAGFSDVATHTRRGDAMKQIYVATV